MDEPSFEFKGVSFLGMLRTVQRHYDEETYATIVERLPGEVGEAFRNGALIASGWYSVRWYAAMAETIAEVVGGGGEALRPIARTAVFDDLSTIFKILRLVLSPEKALQMTMKVTSRYMRGGIIEVAEASDGLLRLRADRHHGFNQLLWWDLVGGAEGVLVSMKVEDIRARITRGGKDGDDWAEIVLQWRPRS